MNLHQHIVEKQAEFDELGVQPYTHSCDVTYLKYVKLGDFVDYKEKCKLFLTASTSRTAEKVIGEIRNLAKYQMKQKAIRFPEYIRGINKTGQELDALLDTLLHSLQGNK